MQICSEYTVPSGRSDGPAVLFSVLTTNTPIGIMAAYPIRYKKAVTYVAVDGSFAGFLALSDTLRQESAETIAALSNLGVQPVLLTGDHKNAARTIIGLLVLGAGICYLVKEKQDAESRKIYTVVSVIGGVLAAVCAVLLFV